MLAGIAYVGKDAIKCLNYGERMDAHMKLSKSTTRSFLVFDKNYYRVQKEYFYFADDEISRSRLLGG